MASFGLVGCENVVNGAVNIYRSYIEDKMLGSIGDGAHKDRMKQGHLNTIKKGVQDLQEMQDPNLTEVLDLIDEKLKDGDLSTYDAYTISTKIREHKMHLIKASSKHREDVAQFKKDLQLN